MTSDSPPGRRGPHPALAALVILAAACGGAPDMPEDPDSRVMRPGDSFFDVLDRVAIEAYPETSFPASLARLGPDVLRTRATFIDPSEWTKVEGLPGIEEAAARQKGFSAFWHWTVKPTLRLDLALGRQWFEHDGRRLRPHTEKRGRQQDATKVAGWMDDETRAAFWWDDEQGVILGLTPKRPLPVAYGYHAETSQATGQLEPVLSTGSVPAEAAALDCRATINKVDRRCLLAPSPSTLALPVDFLAGDALHVAMAVLDMGFDEVNDQLVRRDGLSDGVLFAVDVEQAGATERVWSRFVKPQELYVEDVVDLGAYEGEAVTLRLVTEPGPGGNADFDYALWSGLRLAGETRRPPAHPHVVLIDVDTMRADRLGMYGCERNTSPRLDAWAAEEATVYSDALAANNWTLPSTTSILTGLAVSQHQVRRFPQAITDEIEPIALRLQQIGYETYARSDGGFVAATFGFDTGFDLFDNHRYEWNAHQNRGWDAELERLRRRRSERPVFYFLQTYQVHAPYHPDGSWTDWDPPYDGPYKVRGMSQAKLRDAMKAGKPMPSSDDWQFHRDMYDDGVRRMDDVVGRFVEGLDDVFGDEPYLVILTSDHGEEIEDHGLFGHGHTLYREMLHVPLVVRFPDREGGRVVDSPVSSLDIVPTILDYVGLEIPEHLPGYSLRGDLPDPRVRIAHHEDTAESIQFDGWKLMQGEILGFGGSEGFPRLYQLDEDPDEHDDRSDRDTRRREQLVAMYEEYLARHPPVGSGGGEDQDVDPAVIEELKALGYLGGK